MTPLNDSNKQSRRPVFKRKNSLGVMSLGLGLIILLELSSLPSFVTERHASAFSTIFLYRGLSFILLATSLILLFNNAWKKHQGYRALSYESFIMGWCFSVPIIKAFFPEVSLQSSNQLKGAVLLLGTMSAFSFFPGYSVLGSATHTKRGLYLGGLLLFSHAFASHVHGDTLSRILFVIIAGLLGMSALMGRHSARVHFFQSVIQQKHVGSHQTGLRSRKKQLDDLLGELSQLRSRIDLQELEKICQGYQIMLPFLMRKSEADSSESARLRKRVDVYTLAMRQSIHEIKERLQDLDFRNRKSLLGLTDEITENTKLSKKALSYESYLRWGLARRFALIVIISSLYYLYNDLSEWRNLGESSRLIAFLPFRIFPTLCGIFILFQARNNRSKPQTYHESSILILVGTWALTFAVSRVILFLHFQEATPLLAQLTGTIGLLAMTVLPVQRKRKFAIALTCVFTLFLSVEVVTNTPWNMIAAMPLAALASYKIFSHLHEKRMAFTFAVEAMTQENSKLRLLMNEMEMMRTRIFEFSRLADRLNSPILSLCNSLSSLNGIAIHLATGEASVQVELKVLNEKTQCQLDNLHSLAAALATLRESENLETTALLSRVG